MRKEGTYLGNAGQIIDHDGQRCLQRSLRQLVELLEGAPAPPLGRVLEGEQRLPIRVVPALPQDTRVIPPAGLGSYPHEGRASLARGRRWLLHNAARLSIDHLLRPGSIIGGDRMDLHFPGALL